MKNQISKDDYLKYLKDKLSILDDYSVGEEKLLVQMSLKISQEELFLRKSFEKREMSIVGKYLSLRLQGKPLVKIFHTSSFYGYDFYVNDNVLAPRKETELLVEQAIEQIKKIERPFSVLDLCCGSGAIGISIAKSTNCKVELSDISSKALYVARKNAKALGVQVKILKRDMLFNNKKKYDLIVCNPPYIKSEDIPKLSTGVKVYDPILALDGGEDGLEFYRALSKTAKSNMTKRGVLMMEIGKSQSKVVMKLFDKAGFESYCLRDYSKCDRIVVAKAKGNCYD